MGGDFNIIFDPHLDKEGGRNKLKQQSLNALNNIIANFDLVDIWRIQNPDKRRFTWRQRIWRVFWVKIQFLNYIVLLLYYVMRGHQIVLFRYKAMRNPKLCYVKSPNYVVRNPKFYSADSLISIVEQHPHHLHNWD